jgi:Cu(I)/Ag(I) efflux system periplasmic protein CusF
MKQHGIAACFVALTIALASTLAGVAAFGPALAQQPDLISGRVIRVDQSAGKITIRHGPIKKLGMDHGMTMVFSAQDAAMLKGVKAGERVKFDAEDVNGDYIVTRIEKAK